MQLTIKSSKSVQYLIVDKTITFDVTDENGNINTYTLNPEGNGLIVANKPEGWKVGKHRAMCPEGEEYCCKCGLSYENEIHIRGE